MKTDQTMLKEQVRQALLENWASEVIGMLRDELENIPTNFTKWWNSAPPIQRISFLRAQFKLSTPVAREVVRILTIEK